MHNTRNEGTVVTSRGVGMYQDELRSRGVEESKDWSRDIEGETGPKHGPAPSAPPAWIDGAVDLSSSNFPRALNHHCFASVHPFNLSDASLASDAIQPLGPLSFPCPTCQL